MNFKELGLCPEVLQAIDELGYEEATPIQVMAIPPILEGRDMVGSAQTGTGKTAAFALPTLHRLGSWQFKSKKISVNMASTWD